MFFGSGQMGQGKEFFFEGMNRKLKGILFRMGRKEFFETIFFRIDAPECFYEILQIRTVEGAVDEIRQRSKVRFRIIRWNCRRTSV